ncbi:hypothetical protein O6H91_06G020900 [Diphasiastrum complanatum]|uniref:Uncharacterized protein n=1 Tax=Diphasiastrum complanatum TaxID=34168 RepID=A0ACC2DBC4_DIPCM|nr:hypothetical protein O6H91_06G020900 [Diphasiastrum complanatum]
MTGFFSNKHTLCSRGSSLLGAGLHILAYYSTGRRIQHEEESPPPLGCIVVVLAFFGGGSKPTTSSYFHFIFEFSFRDFEMLMFLKLVSPYFKRSFCHFFPLIITLSQLFMEPIMEDI